MHYLDSEVKDSQNEDDGLETVHLLQCDESPLYSTTVSFMPVLDSIQLRQLRFWMPAIRSGREAGHFKLKLHCQF
eukprot:scaffold1736_cov127-Cylindrotheca_fusiformis.AAC.121